MARFSLGRDDDYDGSSSPDPKRQRTTTNACPTPPPQNPNRNAQESIDSDSAPEGEDNYVVEDEEEDDYVVEDEDEDDDDDEEEEEEEEEEDEFEGIEEDQRGKGKMTEERSECSSIARSAGDGGISVILSDPDVLDCPICLELLTVPVFQCDNGHVACKCCCSKLKNICPSCCQPIGYNRCRAIEKVIESIRISCQNSKYGCKETVPYCKKHHHEHTCLYAPFFCPSIGCTFFSSSKTLYQHFRSKHSNSATRFSYNNVFSLPLMRGSRHVILQEKHEGAIFILNVGSKDLGTVVNVSCIGPITTKRRHLYDLTAKNGETSVELHSVAENDPTWNEHSPEKAFLAVPREFVGSLRGSVLFNLEVCIRTSSRNPAGI